MGDLVKHCIQLQELWLNNNQITAVPEGLVNNCPQLRILFLMNNSFTIAVKELSTFLQQAVNNAETVLSYSDFFREEPSKEK